MKFCSHCASELEFRQPDGDNRQRFICPACDTIFYQNPRIIAGTLPVYQPGETPRVLLCKRAIEPRKGYWTLPAGFMENGETTEQGAIRETREEANAIVSIDSLFTMVSVPHISQVHLFYLATLEKAEYSAGEESLEVALFYEHEIPWQNIAFPTVGRTLKRYFAEKNNPQALRECHSSHIDISQAIKKMNKTSVTQPVTNQPAE